MAGAYSQAAPVSRDAGDTQERDTISQDYLANYVDKQAIAAFDPDRRTLRLRSLLLLPGVVPAEVLALNLAARVLHHVVPWLPDMAGFMLVWNLLLVAGFAGAILARSPLPRHGSPGGRGVRRGAVSGLAIAGILGPLWWGVFTYGEVSMFRALPFVYGTILILLASSLVRAHVRRDPAQLPPGGGGSGHPLLVAANTPACQQAQA